jgi:hypothetical protein
VNLAGHFGHLLDDRFERQSSEDFGDNSSDERLGHFFSPVV